MKFLRLTCTLSVLLLCFALNSFGQAVNATLLGAVTDASGAVVPNAKITITEVNTGISRSGQTNDSGNYTFPDLPPGQYSVTMEATGFKKETRRDIALQVNSTQRVDIQLQPGEVTETIEITGAAPALQTDRADTGRNIDTMVVSELPVLVSNRNYQALLALVPGTSPYHASFIASCWSRSCWPLPPDSWRTVMPARAPSRSTASTKSPPSIARRNVMASPEAWQPKQ